MSSPLFALEEAILYYSDEEIHQLQELTQDDIVPKAESGDAVSQYQLASKFYLGLGVEKDDVAAAEFFQKAAAQGNIPACRKMGLLFHFGEIVEKDIKEALRWYSLAHENGDGDAAILIGIAHLYDLEDSEEAMRWFTLALEKNKTLAYFLIGEAEYIMGDTDGALLWYAKAVENGHRIASVRLGNIYYDKKNFEEGVQWLNANPIISSVKGAPFESQGAVYKKIWGNFSKVAEVNEKILLTKDKIVITPPEKKKEPESEKKPERKESPSISPAGKREAEKETIVTVQEAKNEGEDQIFDEKRQFFKQIINGKEKAKKLLQKSHLSLQNHDWNEAIRTASEAITLHPDYADAYNNRAWGYYEKGLLDESIADCNKALEIDEGHFFALNNRGRAFQKKGDIPSALKDYDAACHKGLEVACENFKKITRLSPKEEIDFLLAKSGEVLTEQSADSVMGAATRLISLDAHKKEAYSRRCAAYVVKGRLQDAYSDCSEVILLNPDVPENYNSLAAIYEQQGEVESALQNYRISCELSNETGCQKYASLSAGQAEMTASHLISEKQVVVQKESVDATVAVVEDVVGSPPEVNVADLLQKSREAFDRKDYDAVIGLSTQIIQGDPENVEAYSNRCGAMAIKNQYQAAHDDCVRAIAIDPLFAMSYNNLGWVYEQQGSKDAALDQYNKSCQLRNSLGCQNYERLMAVK